MSSIASSSHSQPGRPRPRSGTSSKPSGYSSSPTASQATGQSQSAASQSSSSQSSTSRTRAAINRTLAGIRPDDVADSDVDALFHDIGLMEDTQPSSQINDDEMISYDHAMVSQLRTAWLNERGCPELLPYDKDLVIKIQHAIETQESSIDRKKSTNDLDSLECTMLQMEVARIKYMLTSYFRIRLSKIEKYPWYITDTPMMYNRLSSAEQEFARGFRDLLESHFNTSFLDQMIPVAEEFKNHIQNDKFTSQVNSFSKQCRGLNLKNEMQYMVEEPNLSSFIFARVKKTIDRYELEKLGDEISLKEGSILVVSYENVKNLLISDGIELV